MEKDEKELETFIKPDGMDEPDAPGKHSCLLFALMLPFLSQLTYLTFD